MAEKLNLEEKEYWIRELCGLWKEQIRQPAKAERLKRINEKLAMIDEKILYAAVVATPGAHGLEQRIKELENYPYQDRMPDWYKEYSILKNEQKKLEAKYKIGKQK